MTLLVETLVEGFGWGVGVVLGFVGITIVLCLLNELLKLVRGYE